MPSSPPSCYLTNVPLLVLLVLLGVSTTVVAQPTENVALPDAVVGHKYKAHLPISNAVGVINTTRKSGVWPEGLRLDGLWVVGTPEEPTSGNPFEVRVEVRDELGQRVNSVVSIRVLRPPSTTPKIEDRSIPLCIIGHPYDTAIRVLGGTPPFKWSISETEQLPEGLVFSDGRIYGQIDKIIDQPTEKKFALHVKDKYGLSDSRSITLKLQLNEAYRLRLKPSSDPDQAVDLVSAQINREYRYAFAITGGRPPYQFEMAQGTPPPGITLEGITLVGQAQRVGEWSFVMRIQDATGQEAQTACILQVLPEPGPALAIDVRDLPPAHVGQSYWGNLIATGGKPPYRWRVELPKSISNWLDLQGRILKGQVPLDPMLAGPHTLTVTVVDVQETSVTTELQLTVQDPGNATPTLREFQLPSAWVDQPYETYLSAAEHPWEFHFKALDLPQGFTLDPNGRLHGKTTVPAHSIVKLEIYDALGRTSGPLSLPLIVQRMPESEPLHFLDLPLPDALEDKPYVAQLRAIGGVEPRTYQAKGLPPGLALDPSNGELTGTPTQTGNFEIFLLVQDCSSPQPQTQEQIQQLHIAPNTPKPDTLSDTSEPHPNAEAWPALWRMAVISVCSALLGLIAGRYYLPQQQEENSKYVN